MKRYLGLILVVLALTGCVPFTSYEQPNHSNTIQLQAGHRLGQSLVGEWDGLSIIWVYLQPTHPGAGQLRLSIHANPSSNDILAQAELPLSAIRRPEMYAFQFKPIPSTQGVGRYFQLEIIGDGEVSVGAGKGNQYLDGAAYQDGAPVDAQISFYLGYSRRSAILGILKELPGWLAKVGLGIFLFILPGWGLLAWLKPVGRSLLWIEKLSLAIGISLASYPLLFLWTHLINLHLGMLYAWLPGSLGCMALIGSLAQMKFQRSRARQNLPRSNDQRHLEPQPVAPPVNSEIPGKYLTTACSIGGVIVIMLVIISRIWVIRNLNIPLWGDSYQHTLITQLLIDHKGLFDAWSPYAELQSLTYHFGFHSLSAVFIWLSGVSTPLGVLWTGQILNILAVISVGGLAARLVKHPIAPVIALLCAGLLLNMPGIYVNWGRYTQLAGQVLLAPVVWLAWEALEQPKISIKLLSLATLCLAGLALTHYRIIILAILFFVAFIIFENRQTAGQTVLRMAILGLSAGLIFLPWFIHVYTGKIMSTVNAQLVTSPADLTEFGRSYNAIGDPTYYLPRLGWLLCLVAIAMSVWRREKPGLRVAAWWMLVVFAANPQLIGLPGAGVLSNFAIFIAMYIPASLFIGALGGHCLQWLSQLMISTRNRFIPGMVFLLIACLSVWGFLHRLEDIDLTTHTLVTYPDLQAASWIENNTPQSARFLVNGYFAYGNSSVVGADGGWWLPLLAQRSTTLPPLTYSADRKSVV